MELNRRLDYETNSFKSSKNSTLYSVINLILFVIWCYNDHIMKIPQKDSMVATLLACISSGGVLWVCKMIETALFPQCAYLYMLICEVMLTEVTLHGLESFRIYTLQFRGYCHEKNACEDFVYIYYLDCVIVLHNESGCSS